MTDGLITFHDKITSSLETEKHGISFNLTSTRLCTLSSIISSQTNWWSTDSARQAENCLNCWLKGLWVVIKGPSGCWSLEVEPRVWYWAIEIRKQVNYTRSVSVGTLNWRIQFLNHGSIQNSIFFLRHPLKLRTKLNRFQCDNSWQNLLFFK